MHCINPPSLFNQRISTLSLLLSLLSLCTIPFFSLPDSPLGTKKITPLKTRREIGAFSTLRVGSARQVKESPSLLHPPTHTFLSQRY